MPRFRSLSAVLTVLAVMVSSWFAFSWLPSGSAAADTPTRGRPTAGLRVMTYNIRYDNGSSSHAWVDRLPKMAELVRADDPDLMGVQEALHQQMIDLSDALPGYSWIGQGREGGVDGEYSAIFYRTDRLALMKSGDFWLSDTPKVPGSTSWGNHIPRMVSWGLFRDRRTQRLVYHYNTHLDCDATCGTTNGNEVRLKSARLIAERTVDLPQPVILTGDFNAVAGTSDPYRYLTGRGRFGDSWEESELRGPIVGTYNGYHAPQIGGDRIDWILRLGKVRTLRNTIDTTGTDPANYPSDHFPVISDLVVGESPTGPIADETAPQQVDGLATRVDANAVSLSWEPADDNVGVESYNVYGSTDPDAAPGTSTLLSHQAGLAFQHRGLGLGETWYYRVAAVDRLGNIGEPSAIGSVTTSSDQLLFEAEAGVPLLAGSARAESQANCCDLTWSGDHQLLVYSDAVGDRASFIIDVPLSGHFDLAVDATKAGDFATWAVAVDDQTVGQSYNAYASSITLANSIPIGSMDLDSGPHTITFTVTGRDAASKNYRMGIDTVRLTKIS